MTATTDMSASTEVHDYLAAVRHELADLASAERDDLLDDLDDHLQEVLAEGEGSLEERLGPPAQYAAELRASAGLEPATGSSASTAGLLHRAIDALSMNSLWHRTAEHPWARATLDFVPQLRPAWWILRAWLAIEFIVVFDRWRAGYNRDELALVPRLGGSNGLAVVLLIVAVPISIAIGRRSLHGSARWLVIAGNLLAVGMLVPALSALGGVTYHQDVVNSVTPDGLVNNGRPITNIYPYDARPCASYG